MRTMAAIAGALLAAMAFAAGPALAGDPITVCIGQGGAVRVVEATEPCEPGEAMKRLTEWEPEQPEPPDEEELDKRALDRRIQELSSRVAALERADPKQPRPDKTEALSVQDLSNRVAALERSRSRVVAPFEVVGTDGVVILRVAPRVSSENGGGARVTIGAGPSGNYGLRVHRDGGPIVAGIGQSTVGSGLAVVMGEDGQIAANMVGADGRVSVYKGGQPVAGMVAEERGGTVAVYEAGQAVAYLTRSSGGDGGNVTVSLNSGFGVFSAGAAQDGGGEACVDRVTGGGQARRACLGIELPSMGLGK